jgi:hypothetical protein
LVHEAIIPTISKYAALSRVIKKELVILKIQKLDLIYSQSHILHGIILNASLFDNDTMKPMKGTHVDGVIGSIGNIMVN